MTYVSPLFGIDEDGDPAIDLRLAEMAMQASQCPILVRRSPAGTWLVIARDKAFGTFCTHEVDAAEALVDFDTTAWAHALTIARAHREALARMEARHLQHSEEVFVTQANFADLPPFIRNAIAEALGMEGDHDDDQA